ncbi:thiamine pyrophosphokinase [Baffinella frigidus]|nr:thiamine pyrophosphokinase [Cryptophyta sp. CCMP2293]
MRPLRLYSTFDHKPTRARYIPEYIRGDLDSVQAHVSDYYVSRGTTIVKDTDQDTTDLEKCMELLRETNQLTRQVVVLGAFGGRLDHEFSHYNVLFKYPDIDLIDPAGQGVRVGQDKRAQVGPRRKRDANGGADLHVQHRPGGDGGSGMFGASPLPHWLTDSLTAVLTPRGGGA